MAKQTAERVGMRFRERRFTTFVVAADTGFLRFLLAFDRMKFDMDLISRQLRSCFLRSQIQKAEDPGAYHDKDEIEPFLVLQRGG